MSLLTACRRACNNQPTSPPGFTHGPGGPARAADSKNPADSRFKLNHYLLEARLDSTLSYQQDLDIRATKTLQLTRHTQDGIQPIRNSVGPGVQGHPSGARDSLRPPSGSFGRK